MDMKIYKKIQTAGADIHRQTRRGYAQQNHLIIQAENGTNQKKSLVWEKVCTMLF